MADFLLQATISNLLVSSVLATIAWFVQRRYQAAAMANLLWVLVLVKMITPPLYSVRLLEVDSVSQAAAALTPPAPPAPLAHSASSLSTMGSTSPALDRRIPNESYAALGAISAQPEPGLREQGRQAFAIWLPSLWTAWILGTATLLVVSSIRIVRFHRVLRRHQSPASPRISAIAEPLAAEMELARAPTILQSAANISPFVWWIGGQPQIVVPQSAMDQLDDEDLRWVLAHEMAHIKRHDHWVRWLEWLAVLALWWNPLMWWARRQLRVTEEIACDAMVTERFASRRHEYANSLLNMADFLLTTAAIRPPAVASAMTSGGIMEQRLKMIIADTTSKSPPWLRAAVAAIAIGILPLGLVYAQDIEAVKKRLDQAVKAEELSPEQARIMLRALTRSANDRDKNVQAEGSKNDQRDKRERELDGRKRDFKAVANEIEQAVEAGKITREEAKQKLLALRKEALGDRAKARASNKGKGEAREIDARKRKYMAIAEEIERAVEAGKLSKEDAQKKLNAIREDLFEGPRKTEASNKDKKEGKGEAREIDARKRKYMAIAEDIERAVEAGKLSKEDGQKKLNAIREDLFEGPRKTEASNKDEKDGKGEARDLDTRKRKYMAIAEDIERAVKAGKLSKEDAQKKLNAVREDLFEGLEKDKASNKDKGEGKGEAREIDARKRKYMAIAEEIERAVKAGKISKEDAQKKLNAVREEMFEGARKTEASNKDKGEGKGEGKGEAREIDARKRKYMAIAEEIERAVKAGKISKEDARKKLNAVREEMFEGARKTEASNKDKGEGKGEAREIDARKRKYMAIAEEIERGVRAGKISKEDAQKKLNAVREEMFEGARKTEASNKDKGEGKGEAREIDARKRKYMAIAEEIERGVRAGKISKEDAQKKLISLRQQLFGDSERK